MKVLKFFILSLVFFTLADAAKAEQTCVTGNITNFNYNSDNSISISIGKYNLYTDRAALEPYLFMAFMTGSTVEIKTSTCRNGGGFAEVNFKNQ